MTLDLLSTLNQLTPIISIVRGNVVNNSFVSFLQIFGAAATSPSTLATWIVATCAGHCNIFSLYVILQLLPSGDIFIPPHHQVNFQQWWSLKWKCPTLSIANNKSWINYFHFRSYTLLTIRLSLASTCCRSLSEPPTSQFNFEKYLFPVEITANDTGTEIDTGTEVVIRYHYPYYY